MARVESVREALTKHQQEHLLAFWDDLDDLARASPADVADHEL